LTFAAADTGVGTTGGSPAPLIPGVVGGASIYIAPEDPRSIVNPTGFDNDARMNWLGLFKPIIKLKCGTAGSPLTLKDTGVLPWNYTYVEVALDTTGDGKPDWDASANGGLGAPVATAFQLVCQSNIRTIAGVDEMYQWTSASGRLDWPNWRFVGRPPTDPHAPAIHDGTTGGPCNKGPGPGTTQAQYPNTQVLDSVWLVPGSTVFTPIPGPVNRAVYRYVVNPNTHSDYPGYTGSVHQTTDAECLVGVGSTCGQSASIFAFKGKFEPLAGTSSTGLVSPPVVEDWDELGFIVARGEADAIVNDAQAAAVLFGNALSVTASPRREIEPNHCQLVGETSAGDRNGTRMGCPQQGTFPGHKAKKAGDAFVDRWALVLDSQKFQRAGGAFANTVCHNGVGVASTTERGCGTSTDPIYSIAEGDPTRPNENAGRDLYPTTVAFVSFLGIVRDQNADGTIETRPTIGEFKPLQDLLMHQTIGSWADVANVGHEVDSVVQVSAGAVNGKVLVLDYGCRVLTPVTFHPAADPTDEMLVGVPAPPTVTVLDAPATTRISTSDSACNVYGDGGVAWGTLMGCTRTTGAPLLAQQSGPTCDPHQRMAYGVAAMAGAYLPTREFIFAQGLGTDVQTRVQARVVVPAGGLDPYMSVPFLTGDDAVNLIGGATYTLQDIDLFGTTLP
ncbi:MAG: hypothetical protein ACT4PT_04520, partial [Methanobacteriota archaeon]